MPELAVGDAHALIWHATGRQKKLGVKARRFLKNVDSGRAALYIPTMALVEIAEASHRGIIRFQGGFSRWCEALLASPRFIAVDLTAEVVLKAEEFYGIEQRGDRLIAATAACLQLPLITRDESIQDDHGVSVLW